MSNVLSPPGTTAGSLRTSRTQQRRRTSARRTSAHRTSARRAHARMWALVRRALLRRALVRRALVRRALVRRALVRRATASPCPRDTKLYFATIGSQTLKPIANWSQPIDNCCDRFGSASIAFDRPIKKYVGVGSTGAGSAGAGIPIASRTS